MLSESLRNKKITICSQNLENFGLLDDMRKRNRKITLEKRIEKIQAIVDRILLVNCDLIALQEVLGKKERTAQRALEDIAALLQERTGEKFLIFTGPSNDSFSRLAYLLRRNIGEMIDLRSYKMLQLPQLSSRQRPRRFSRGPLELRIAQSGSGREITLINFHLKSKAFAYYDGTKLSWESYRMEQAEMLRKIALAHLSEQRNSEVDNTLILLGDRNSHFDAASAKVLDGRLELADFQTLGSCSVSKKGISLCPSGIERLPSLIGVISANVTLPSDTGTFLYKNQYRWIDEIYLLRSDLELVETYTDRRNNYYFKKGVTHKYQEASDHGLLWVTLQ